MRELELCLLGEYDPGPTLLEVGPLDPELVVGRPIAVVGRDLEQDGARVAGAQVHGVRGERDAVPRN